MKHRTNVPLTRIYIPATSKQPRRIDDFNRNLGVLLAGLFGDDLLCVKSKTGMEYHDFHELDDVVLISTDRRVETV